MIPGADAKSRVHVAPNRLDPLKRVQQELARVQESKDPAVWRLHRAMVILVDHLKGKER